MMKLTIAESVPLDAGHVCTIAHLAEVSGLSREELEELVGIGLIVPADAQTEPLLFQLRTVVTACTARRLRDDFELDHNGVALALTLLQRIEQLQQELTALRARSR
ncbi:chaperone modulator CbpM [Actimicrobium sp. CCC2.4]|jgi:chaperone modulatory protein CbpM|uniref:chaperone modulator CbpM n=2 Tax=Actimicrobium sp. CCC2.4 TaxID=3048606 RepID=UPI002AC955C1|nr:chaperone modulator CbpM [Actimicrobium sp. CCC2.4]WPX33594.1 chaperone modulator CbpM [Actimicrobium sp. CCC2.4]